MIEVLQSEVRIRFQRYLKDSGIKQSYVAERNDLATDILSRFKNGKKDLFLTDLQKLDAYLTSKGY